MEDNRKKLLEKSIVNKKGFDKLGECMGSWIRDKLDERRRNYKPKDLKELTRETLGRLGRDDF